MIHLRYTVEVTTGSSQYITATIGAGSGVISPANAASNLFWLLYQPEVVLSLSDGLEDGSTTSIPEITVFATFSSPVTSVTLGAFTVIGGTTSQLVALTPNVYV